MLTAINPQTRIDFVYPAGDDDPTVFELRPLTVSEITAMRALEVETETERLVALVSHGLAGWRNFEGVNGFDATEQAANIDRIPYDAFVAIAGRLAELSGLTVDQVGNSESPSPTV